ncbi:MAG: ABC transporter ATP-binding protein [Actinomycetota bacterium]
MSAGGSTGSRGAVLLEDAGKRYVKYDDAPLLLSRAVRFRAGSKRAHLWAVRNVDLEVVPGETVGVIGRNGSGKSTMLRMLAGVTAPTEGAVVVHGRVAPLIAVGVGFHPELTGRENVYVNATVLGLRRREIDRLFDSIVDFAEIGEFIDTPVKFYSSGMFVRLGFSVAVATRPDVLLVDEVLAVGDLEFQSKCFERMEEIRNEGTSVLVVSHNLPAVNLLCSRTLVLQNGVVKFLGPTEQAISLYQDLTTVRMEEQEAGADPGDPVALRSPTLAGEDGHLTNHIKFGEEVTFSMEIEFRSPLNEPTFTFLLANERNQVVYTDFARGDHQRRRFEGGERARFDVTMRTTLPSGSYQARCGVHWRLGEKVHRISRDISFFVSGRPMVKGLADLNASMSVEGGRVEEGGSPSGDDPIDGSPVDGLGSDALRAGP